MSKRSFPGMPPAPSERPSRERAFTAARATAKLIDPPQEHSAVVPRTHNFEHFVRIDRHGRVLTGHGRAEELAGLSAFACRMGDVIGELLSFGKVSAIEATFAGGSVFVCRDGGGEVVGMKPHERVSLRQLRARLNL